MYSDKEHILFIYFHNNENHNHSKELKYSLL